MSSKFLEGLSLVAGMCLLMHAWMGNTTQNEAARPAELATRGKQRWNLLLTARATVVMAGSCLLLFGLWGALVRGR